MERKSLTIIKQQLQNQLEEKVIQLNKYNEYIFKLEISLNNLKQELYQERQICEDSIELLKTYHNFQKNNLHKQDLTNLQITFINKKIDETRNEINELYINIKQYEHVEEKKKKEHEAKMLKKEQQIIDEMTIQKFYNIEEQG